MELSTQVTGQGGTFSLRLPVIPISTADGTYKQGDITKSGKDIIDKIDGEYIEGVTANFDEYEFMRIKNPAMLKSAIEYDGQFYQKTPVRTTLDYYSKLISSNDLLFISFSPDRLERIAAYIPSTTKRRDADDFSVETAINENVFDMICLVDDVKVVYDAVAQSQVVEVSGRDLMKLIIDDGSFFFNVSHTSAPSEVFVNDSVGAQGDVREVWDMDGQINNPLNRLRHLGSGELDMFMSRLNLTIAFILKGVISQLANVEVVPSNIFDAWGDERTRFIELVPEKIPAQ
jgi:hypothetical protein